MRYANLISSVLPIHPQYSDPKTLKLKKTHSARLQNEVIPIIQRLYDTLKTYFSDLEKESSTTNLDLNSPEPTDSQSQVSSTAPPVIYDEPQVSSTNIGDIDSLPSAPATSLDSNSTLPGIDTATAYAPPIVENMLVNGSGIPLVPAVPRKFQSGLMSDLAALQVKKPVRVKTVSFKLRDVIFYGEMLNKFMELASRNTAKNVETCAFLCGILNAHENKFIITTLVIPKQSGSSDTCQALDEESTFAYQDSQSLLTLGWIHTHPAYEAFLSSVDLHTHCGYQSMLPESIAIVMAPRFKPSYQIFQLTDPYGLKLIQDCPHGSNFHSHPKPPPPIYAPAPPHVIIDWTKEKKFTVKDLR